MTNVAPETERILVVDDEPDIVALVVYHLAKAKYRVSSAASAPMPSRSRNASAQLSSCST